MAVELALQPSSRRPRWDHFSVPAHHSSESLHLLNSTWSVSTCLSIINTATNCPSHQPLSTLYLEIMRGAFTSRLCHTGTEEAKSLPFLNFRSQQALILPGVPTSHHELCFLPSSFLQIQSRNQNHLSFCAEELVGHRHSEKNISNGPPKPFPLGKLDFPPPSRNAKSWN